MELIEASVAGGTIRAELHGTHRVRVTLPPPGLRGRTVLARHLEELGRVLAAKRARAVLAAAGAKAEPPALGWRAEEYVRRRAAIVSCGRSADGTVTIQVEGMRRWRVDITAAVTAEAVEQAAGRLLRDQARQIRALKRTIWEPGAHARRES